MKIAAMGMRQSKIVWQKGINVHSMKRWEDLLNKASLLFTRPLQAEEIQTWENFLEPLSKPELEYAFDNWLRNGRYFPRPHDILELVEAYRISETTNHNRFTSCGKCEEGWIRVFEGKTAGGNPVDPKLGAMERCECFNYWKAQRAS